MSGTLRLFAAVPVSAQVREAAAGVMAQLQRAGADFKWVEPENLHLTLRFYGATAEERLPELEAALRRAAQKRAFELRYGALGAFASWDHPRVVWIGVSRGAEELSALAEALGPAQEDRPFSAHLTIGRMRSPKGLSRLKAASSGLSFLEIAQRVDRLVLFESRLGAHGPTYAARKEEPLQP